jgi:hypothetical protein
MSLILSGTDGLSDVDGSAATPAIRGTDANTGIFFPAADTIAFAEGGTEAMRLDSSGNLGLGVTPSAWFTSANSKVLQIPSGALSSTGLNELDLTQNGYLNAGATSFVRVNAGYASQYVQISGQHQWFNAASSTAGSNITFTQAMTLDASGNLLVGTTTANGKATIAVADSSVQKGVTIQGTDASAYGGYLGWSDVWSGDSYRGLRAAILGDVPSANAGRLRFFTASSSTLNEVGRFDSSGNLLVGTISASGSGASSGKQVIQFNGATGNGLYVDDTRTSSGTDNAVIFGRGATAVGQISTTTTSTSYVTSSDYRLKENVAPMTGALEKVLELNPVTYTWKVDGSDGRGFIAHELQEVCPDAVTGEKDAVETYTDEDGVEQTRPVYQGIDTSFLVATLTAAIQEQQAIIQTLTDRITALEQA